MDSVIIELEGGRTITIKEVGPSDIAVEGNGRQLVVYPHTYTRVDIRTLGGLDSRESPE